MLVLAAAVFAGGCTTPGSVPGWSRRADVTLTQRNAPPHQRNLRLVSEWAWSAELPDCRKCLLAFRLPGSEAGPRAFVIYCTGPARMGDLAVGPSAADVHGFLIQELGELAGKSSLAAGTLTWRPVPLRPRFRRLELHVACEDGTEINGRALVEERPHEVQIFERQKSGDVALLNSPTTASSTSASPTSAPADETAPRPTR